MRTLVQRVSWARVEVDGEEVGVIEEGILGLVGLGVGDSVVDMRTMAQKLVHLRIFEDEAGKMNRSVLDIGGKVLLVSQFTLYGDCRKGRRPSFGSAMPPGEAEEMFDGFVEEVRSHGVEVETGRFRTEMAVSLCNDGPVTIWLETREGKMV